MHSLHGAGGIYYGQKEAVNFVIYRHACVSAIARAHVCYMYISAREKVHACSQAVLHTHTHTSASLCTHTHVCKSLIYTHTCTHAIIKGFSNNKKIL